MMKRQIIILVLAFFALTSGMAQGTLKYRGIVYDVGLQFNTGSYSVDSFDVDLVTYDFSVISNILRANTVRIEGEDINRLVEAAKIANRFGLKVFFNPWKMNADEKETIAYMSEAAKSAEKLRLMGIDVVFVMGCEYSIFDDGVFKGNTINERLASLASTFKEVPPKASSKVLSEKMTTLNKILSNVCHVVRSHFNGTVTYASGTWEAVDWSLFDMVGVDYYRSTQTDKEYTDGIQHYTQYNKPVVVMEVGCCAYEGAAQKGGAGFTVLQGVTADGEGIYEGGVKPKRSEKEQADYDQNQIDLISKTAIDGIFIYVFSFPIMPYSEIGLDRDMASYSLVKTYSKYDRKSKNLPPWLPNEAFYKVADVYRQLELSK